ncbi:MAG: YceI family protein [Anaerolineae bacterium]
MLDMASIAATEGSQDRLLQHLNSDDFFSTATFPTASLVINSAESLGDGTYAVLGDLTIKEITNPIEFTATAAEEDGVVTASADIVFDRALYDVQFGSGSFFSDLGDDLISDEIEITVELVAMSGEMAMAEEVVADEAMAEGSAGTYTVSTADSTVTWTGSKPVGNSHTGVVDMTEGELTLADGALVSGSFMLDMTSIAATDGSPDRLIQHLNSDDFFGTVTFPTASLVINSAESLGDGTYAVLGDLTIKEITNPIEFTATATEADGVVTASADIVFDRALYDVQFGSGSFFSDLGDDLISDEIEITVELVAQK